MRHYAKICLENSTLRYQLNEIVNMREWNEEVVETHTKHYDSLESRESNISFEDYDEISKWKKNQTKEYKWEKNQKRRFDSD